MNHIARRASLVLLGCMTALPVSAAEPAETVDWTPPRLQNGHPDLGGVWDFRTLTPFERPEDLGERALLTEEEAADIERESATATAKADAPSKPAEARERPEVGASVGGYNRFWLDSGARVSSDLRSSLIVDPVDGRLPALQPGIEVQRGRDEAPVEGLVRVRVGGAGTDNPEDRGLSERCLLGFNVGPPIVPAGYNQNISIVQTDDHVVMLNEMNHDARIIRLESEHLPPEITTWMGDSIATWDDDTLVIETTNFTHKRGSLPSNVFTSVGTGEALHIVERMELVDDDTLRYEFTVTDPKTYTAPITAVLLMKRSSDTSLYEYACHEGNYAMGNMLRGARLLEKQAASP